LNTEEEAMIGSQNVELSGVTRVIEKSAHNGQNDKKKINFNNRIRTPEKENGEIHERSSPKKRQGKHG